MAYLTALKCLMYSMAKAGSFEVLKGDDKIFFCPLQNMLEHLANAELFVTKHFIESNVPEAA
eukprot:1393872-Amphidinium_carterae.1